MTVEEIPIAKLASRDREARKLIGWEDYVLVLAAYGCKVRL